MKKSQVIKLVHLQTTKIQGKVDKIISVIAIGFRDRQQILVLLLPKWTASLILVSWLNKDIIKNNVLQVEKLITELINDYQKQLSRQKTSIINELKSSEKFLLEITKQNPKLLKIESLNIKLETKKPPVHVGVSSSIGRRSRIRPSEARSWTNRKKSLGSRS